MFAVTNRMLSDKKNAILAYCLSIVAFMEMYIALYPALRDQADQLNKLLDSYPESFFKAFGLEKGDLTFQHVETYLSSEIYSFIWPILAVILAGSMANYSIAAEIEKGTIELTLAQPISRVRLFFSRYAAGVLTLCIFAMVTALSIIPLAALHDVAYNLNHFLKMGLVSCFFGTAIFSIAMLFSAIFSEKGKASFATGGVIILMYVINIVSGLKDNLENLKYLSFFHYYSPSQILGKGIYPDYTFWVFGGVIIAATTAAVLIFKKRDIAS